MSEAIRQWVRQFSDAKLAEVFAFNQDGKMSPTNPCACILGVTLAPKMHVQGQLCDGANLTSHYSKALKMSGSYNVEAAYDRLGRSSATIFGAIFGSVRKRRNKALGQILREEMERRAFERARDLFVSAYEAEYQYAKRGKVRI